MGWCFKFKDFPKVIQPGDSYKIKSEGETLRVRVTGFDCDPQHGEEPIILGEIVGFTDSPNFYNGYEVPFRSSDIIE